MTTTKSDPLAELAGMLAMLLTEAGCDPKELADFLYGYAEGLTETPNTCPQ